VNPVAPVVDAALELLVVPGFTTPGLRLRRRLYGWEDLGNRSLRGRTVVITGATSGIGRATAVALAAMGATVWTASRDADRARRAEAELRESSGSDAVHVDTADLSRAGDARRWAEAVGARIDQLDVLLHVAGAYFGERTETGDGIEANAALYVLGPYVITDAFDPLLRRTPGARVVTVTTGGMYAARLDVGHIEAPVRGYRPLAAYAHAKRAQVALTHQWAERFRADGVVAHAVQPGWCRTPLVEEGLPRFGALLGPVLRSAEEGADTVVWCAVADEPGRTSGLVWRDRHRRGEHRVPWTITGRDEDLRLWRWCEEHSVPA
jgi:dehydrogenase/reductase SDR family member 12